MLRNIRNLFVVALLVAAILALLVGPVLVFAGVEGEVPAKVTKLVPVVLLAIATIAFLLLLPRARRPMRHNANGTNTGITNTDQAREAAIRGLRNRARAIETALGALPEQAQKHDKWLQLQQARGHINRQEFGLAVYLLRQLEHWIAYVTEPMED